MSAAIRPPYAPAAHHAHRAVTPRAPSTASGFASLLGPGTNTGNSLGGDVVEVFNAHGFFLPAPETAEKIANAPGEEASADQRRPAPGGQAQHAAPSRPIVHAPFDGDQAGPSPETILGLSAKVPAGGLLCVYPDRPPPAAGRPPPDNATGRLAPASAGKSAAANNEAPARANAPRLPVKDPRAGATLPERLVFQIGAQSVALSGRLNHLGPDEQERLLERLSALLGAHGLGLGEVSLNGRPILQYFQGSAA